MKKVLFTTIISLLLIACSGTDPVQWNNGIVQTYNKLNDDIEKFEELISYGVIGDSVVLDQINVQAQSILSDLDITITSLSKNDIPEKGENYQKVILDVLESMKGQITTGLEFTSFTEETPEETIEAYGTKYDTLSGITAEKVKKLKSAQKEFMKSIEIEQK